MKKVPDKFDPVLRILLFEVNQTIFAFGRNSSNPEDVRVFRATDEQMDNVCDRVQEATIVAVQEAIIMTVHGASVR